MHLHKLGDYQHAIKNQCHFIALITNAMRFQIQGDSKILEALVRRLKNKMIVLLLSLDQRLT